MPENETKPEETKAAPKEAPKTAVKVAADKKLAEETKAAFKSAANVEDKTVEIISANNKRIVKKFKVLTFKDKTGKVICKKQHLVFSRKLSKSDKAKK